MASQCIQDEVFPATLSPSTRPRVRLGTAHSKMPSPRTELQIVNIVHCAQLVLAGAVLGIGIYKMFFAKNRAAARTGRWALSVVSCFAKYPSARPLWLIRRRQSHL